MHRVYYSVKYYYARGVHAAYHKKKKYASAIQLHNEYSILIRTSKVRVTITLWKISNKYISRNDDR